MGRIAGIDKEERERREMGWEVERGPLVAQWLIRLIDFQSMP